MYSRSNCAGDIEIGVARTQRQLLEIYIRCTLCICAVVLLFLLVIIDRGRLDIVVTEPVEAIYAAYL
jgi:hypothetical protein